MASESIAGKPADDVATPSASDAGQATLANIVRVCENGPLVVRAPVLIDGRPAGLRVSLCRCGGSHRKPLCDGSHAENGFRAPGEIPAGACAALAQSGGPLEVHPIPNGPLHVKGNLELVSESGELIDRMTEAWLCRCGHSGNKPFCDGTHKRIGFRS